MPVLERVLHNAEQVQTAFDVERVCRAIPLYVQNSSYARALDILDRQKFVIISGVPGIGKTTLADLLLFTHLEKAFEPVVIQSDIADGRRLFHRERKQIFYFDDFLGETFLGSRADFVGRKEDAALLDFMELIKQSKHSRLILTTREHILRQAFDMSERFNRGKGALSVHQCVLELASYSLTERGRILYNHIYFSDLPPPYKAELLRDRFYLDILKHRNFNPRLVEWLSKFTNVQNLEADNYRDEVRRVLDDPVHLWRIAYERQISDAARSLLLAVYSLGGGVSRRRLETAWQAVHQARIARYHLAAAPEDFRKSLQDLEGGFLSIRIPRLSFLPADEIGFINPSVKDFFDGALVADKANLEDLLASAIYFDQVVHLWTLFEAKIESAPQLKSYAAVFIAAAERLAWRPHWLERKDGLGMRTFSYEDAVPESRFNTIVKMAEHSRLSQALDLAERYAVHLEAHWRDSGANFWVATNGLTLLDQACWNALKDTRMHERLKMALLEDAEDGVGSDDLKALIAYTEEQGAQWFAEDDQRLDALCEGYLSGKFGEELSDCSSEGDLSSLEDAVSKIADKCGVSHDQHQEEIAERMSEFQAPDIDDDERPSTSWTERNSGPPSEARQEAEVIDLFDGLR